MALLQSSKLPSKLLENRHSHKQRPSSIASLSIMISTASIILVFIFVYVFNSVPGGGGGVFSVTQNHTISTRFSTAELYHEQWDQIKVTFLALYLNYYNFKIVKLKIKHNHFFLFYSFMVYFFAQTQ